RHARGRSRGGMPVLAEPRRQARGGRDRAGELAADRPVVAGPGARRGGLLSAASAERIAS
ncbi:hypothetical protein, partial [Frankia sp. CiP1_Cm_nod1]|uniref:hypothetical protein n=1 Tax=Frankia sp. CiP1_Cm_nod1 TaxID=2897160 RepID=UPI0020241FD6